MPREMPSQVASSRSKAKTQAAMAMRLKSKMPVLFCGVVWGGVGGDLGEMGRVRRVVWNGWLVRMHNCLHAWLFACTHATAKTETTTPVRASYIHTYSRTVQQNGRPEYPEGGKRPVGV